MLTFKNSGKGIYKYFQKFGSLKINSNHFISYVKYVAFATKNILIKANKNGL